MSFVSSSEHRRSDSPDIPYIALVIPEDPGVEA